MEAAAGDHFVEIGDAGRDALLEDAVLEAERGDRQHAEPVAVDEERVLVGAVRRTAIFHDPQAPRRDLVVDAVVEQQHAVRDVFLQPLAREGAVAALGGDHGGQAAFLEPVEQAADLGPQDRRIGEGGEQALDGVEHHALGADRFDRQFQAQEERLEIVVADLGEFARIDRDMFEGDLLSSTSRSRAKPSDATLGTMSTGRSSKVTNTPGSSKSRAP